MHTQETRGIQALNTALEHLYNVDNHTGFFREVLETLCVVFRLYGASAVMRDETGFVLYTLRSGRDRDRYYEGVVHPREHDPYLAVMASGQGRMLEQDLPFSPVLPGAAAGAIVPVRHQGEVIGALGLFEAAGSSIEQQDLLLCEMFAGHLATAQQRLQRDVQQARSVHSSQMMLRAWERMVNAHNRDDIAQHLQGLLEEVPGVQQAVVWLPGEDEGGGDAAASTQDAALRQMLEQLEAAGFFRPVYEKFHYSLGPVTLWENSTHSAAARRLFKHLDTQALVLFPVTDSARIAGMALVGSFSSGPLSEDAALMVESLCQTGGRALERLTFVQMAVEQQGRLEAVLRSVSEGVFFVDENGCVSFCNPQFTELTGISPSTVIGQPAEMLLQRLAECAEQPTGTLQRLQNAVGSMIPGHDYPILELQGCHTGQSIYLELMVTERLDGERFTWAGLLREAEGRTASGVGRALLDGMQEYLRIPYAHMQGMIDTLLNRHDRLEPRIREHMLRELERESDRIGLLWDSFSELYRLEIVGAAPAREQIMPDQLIDRALDSRALRRMRRYCSITGPQHLTPVEVDVAHTVQALASILACIFEHVQAGTQVEIELQSEKNRTIIHLRSEYFRDDSERMQRVFSTDEPALLDSDDPQRYFGLYFSRELLHRQGGHVRFSGSRDAGISISITLPGGSGAAVYSDVTAAHEVAGSPVPARSLQKIMVIRGRSGLTGQLTELLESRGCTLELYDSGSEAVRSLHTTRFDVVVLDASLRDEDSLQVCASIRRQTPVPVVVLTDKPSSTEKVQFLGLRVDGYIANPASTTELLADINAIFERLQMADRASDPILIGDLKVDLARREVFLKDTPVELTRIEYDLLRVLVINQGQTLEHQQLLTLVWGPEYRNEKQYLWVNLSRLRKKIEPTPDSPRYIYTRQGVGYVLRKP